MLLSLAWLPLAMKFQRAWQVRKNPVSLAICATALLLAYTNVIFAFAMVGETSWRFYAIATRALELVVLVNFFVAFRWSDAKFAGARKSDPDPPPPA